MSTDSTSPIAADVLSSARSRTQFLKGVAFAAAGFGIAAPAIAHAGGGGTGGMPSGGLMTESTQTIFNIAATAETLAVTAFYNVHEQVLRGAFDTTGIAVPANTLVSVVRAILREEQDHLSFLLGAGARPLYTSFTFPPVILTSALAALHFVEQAETVFVAAYMAANREFASAGMAQLAQYTYQIGAVEAEHRTLARAALGELPPNNKSYETKLYNTVGEAATTLANLGLLKPGVAYPGTAAVDTLLATTVTKDVTAGVIQRHP